MAGLVAAAALALSVFGWGTVNAGTPAGWVAGFGTDSSPAVPQPSSGASSTAVSAGNKVGFFEWLRNNGPSNISQLFVSETTSAPVAGALWSIKDNNLGTTLRSGSCPVATPPVCSFGAVNAGQTIYLLAVFSVPSNIADGQSLSVAFDWNTTGIPPGKNNSHGDALSKADSVIVTSNGDAAGDFNLDNAAGLTVSTVSVGGLNTQSTSVTIAATQVGAAVADGPQLTTPCNRQLTSGFPSWFKCSALSSLTSTVEVGNGAIFNNPNGSGTPGITVTISFASAPNQLHGGHPFVYHYWKDASGVAHAELITVACTPGVAFPDFPSNLGPCLTVGTNSVIVWLLHNGPMRT